MSFYQDIKALVIKYSIGLPFTIVGGIVIAVVVFWFQDKERKELTTKVDSLRFSVNHLETQLSLRDSIVSQADSTLIKGNSSSALTLLQEDSVTKKSIVLAFNALAKMNEDADKAFMSHSYEKALRIYENIYQIQNTYEISQKILNTKSIMEKFNSRNAPLRDATQSMSPMALKRILLRKGLFCRYTAVSHLWSNAKSSGFPNMFEVIMEYTPHVHKINGGGSVRAIISYEPVTVIVDYASKLLWQLSSTNDLVTYTSALKDLAQLNHDSYANHNDWRLPTIEEAMSLMEPQRNNQGLFIDTLFSMHETSIWTTDYANESTSWIALFDSGYCRMALRTSAHAILAVCNWSDDESRTTARNSNKNVK